MADTDDLLSEGRETFDDFREHDNHNRETGLADIKFARGGEQWPEDIRKQRELDGRPCLTINKLPAFLRQVVNDARQNKPSISVHPVDDNADVETADIIGDLIRNIEYTSDADVAYDTGVECATSNGFGYWRILADYSYDDSFEQDLKIGRIRNPFSVYGDPYSTAADSSDWDGAFVTDRLSKAQFKRQWGDKAEVDWDDTDAWGGDIWRNDDGVIVAEWWKREHVDKPVYLVGPQDGADGQVYVLGKTDLESPDVAALLESGMLVVRQERTAKSCKVTQRFMSGAEILETREWPGKYIPIIPVYGDEFDIEGKVYRRSLIHDAIGPQQMFNYWRTSATELVALAPRVPFIGPKGAFKSDKGWNTVNRVSHPYLEYDGAQSPQRQMLDSGAAAGSLQEALNASDDMKAVTGLYDASLGARSNETSGRAILARQREGDVSTFHFSDNLARAIRHTGRVLIDLIPHYYNTARIIRVRGEDGTERAVQINQAAPKTNDEGQPVQDEAGNVVMALHDLTKGKYDLTVTTGPSFTTRRQEAAAEMTELIRAFPQIAPLIGDLLARNLDWPGADEIAERLKRMVPKEALGDNGGLPPQLQQFIQEGQAMITALTQQVETLKNDRTADLMNAETKRTEAATGQFEAETDRMEAQTQRINALTPEPQPQPAIRAA
jgi:hypothetical protein